MPQSQFIILGTQGKNLEARTEARHHGGMLLTDLQTVASLSCLLHHLGPSVQEFVTTHGGLGPSTLRKCPTDLPTGQSNKTIIQDDSSLYQVHKNNNNRQTTSKAKKFLQPVSWWARSFSDTRQCQ